MASEFAAFAVVGAVGIFFIVIGLVLIAATAKWCAHVVRFAPLQMAGCVATAEVTGCRQRGDADYVPLVTYVTRRGETRRSVPVLRAAYTHPPLLLDKPFTVRQVEDEVFSWSDDERPRAPAPPIGQPVHVVYDPNDPAAASYRITGSVVFGVLAVAWLAGILSLGYSVPRITTAVGPWIDGRTLSVFGHGTVGSLALVAAFVATAALLKDCRYRRLEKSGYVAPAVAGFWWNVRGTRYEPVLRFTTRTGEQRQSVLDPTSIHRRLPRASAATVVYDPNDASFAEPSYRRARGLRPTAQVAIGLLVALFTILAVPPALMWGPAFAPLRVSAAVGLSLGLALGVLAAITRAMQHGRA